MTKATAMHARPGLAALGDATGAGSFSWPLARARVYVRLTVDAGGVKAQRGRRGGKGRACEIERIRRGSTVRVAGAAAAVRECDAAGADGTRGHRDRDCATAAG